MKAVFVTRFGPPDVLEIREVPRPEPGHGEVLVRVKSIGLNFAEVFGRLGVYPSIPDPPFVPGIECSGVIESVGSGVRRVKRGDKVMVFSRQGSYAEYVCTPERFVTKMPRGLSFDVAAALSVTYYSAYHGLVTLANIRKGEKVLIHAGAGGVGTAAIQIAKYLGAEVFATVGSDEKVQIATGQGADHVVNYRTEDFGEFVKMKTGGEGIDVVLDSVGGEVFKRGWNLLAPMGRYVVFGFAAVTGKSSISKIKALGQALRVPWIFPPSLVSKNVSLMGFNLYFLTHKVQYFRSVSDTILGWYSRKIIRPVLGRKFPLSRIVDAHTFLQSRKSVGKLIVDVDAERTGKP